MASGYLYEFTNSTGASSALSLLTGSRVAKNVLKRKQLKYIYHMMNTHGKNVTMTVYIDGVAKTPTFTINTSTLTTRRIEDIPTQWEGYRFDIQLTCSGVTDDELEIYAPVTMMFTLVGD